MIQNFVKGIVVGGVVAGIGLGVMSQLAPLPSAQAPAPLAMPLPEPEIGQASSPEPPVPALPEVVVEAPPPSVKPSAEPAPSPVLTAPAVVSLAPLVPVQPEQGGAAPQIAAVAPQPPVINSPAALPSVSVPDPTPKAEALPSEGPAEEALLLPPPESPSQPVEPQLVEPQPVEPQKPSATEVLPPVADLPKTVDGVTVGRLPSIGAAAAPQPDVVPEPAAATPLVQFARPFTNEAGKPLFAVVLKDSGGVDLDRVALASLPFPISFVLDPMDPTASDAEKIYRAGGQEVVMLASGIPKGANPADLEQSFQINDAVLPEAVVVMDLDKGGFQDDRSLSTQVVTVVKEMGRGLLTYDRGLNAADQVARREGLPAAVIFRELDAQGEAAPLIRRYLDRAAFKAAQEGRVVVLGTTSTETITALMEWAVEGRGASVALAPISAVLTK